MIHCLPTGTLETSVYRKSTHSDVVLNFHSNCPASQKQSCIKALFFSRLHTHCSSPVARKPEKAYLYEMLLSNGYPINFIKQATRPARSTTTSSNEPEKPPPTIWRSLPYIQDISESVAGRLNPYNVKIAHKPHSALRSNLVHVKDPIPTLQRRKVIYQIPCSGCDKTHWTNRSSSRNKAQRTPLLCQMTRYKLVSCATLHGHGAHL